MSLKCYLAFGAVIATTIAVTHGDDAQTSLSNSCVGKADGSYWLQLLEDDYYMPVYLQCSNEHIILDVNKDSNLESYFSSFEMWHTRIAGPSNSDPVNWNDWFLPSYYERSRVSTEAGGNFYLSPDCASCETDAVRQVHDSLSSYWMTGNLAKLHWPIIGFNECDMDYDTYQCYDCTDCLLIGGGCEPVAYDDNSTYYEKSGICGVTVQEATKSTYTRRRIAQQTKKIHNYKPSLGTEGAFCMCYQPNTVNEYPLSQEQVSYIEQNKEKEKEKEKEEKENNDENVSENVSKNEKNSNNKNEMNPQSQDNKFITVGKDSVDLRATNTIYLSQSDFQDGTYRIKESGTYVLTEDITFDFNKDDDYWPRADQIDDYPGAGKYRDAYHLGFFAGITIECDYVTIDLNEHEMKMSLHFYYQQRWFAIIELGNQQFLPGQGPAYFGNDPQLIEHITITNGVLGLTSHFGIHGNFPSDLTITDLHIRNFVTHGMQLNGWENLEMNNIEIGPSSQIEYLRGDYGHARIVIDRLKAIADDMVEQGRSIEEERVPWANHGIVLENGGSTIEDIIENLEFQMNVAYSYATNRVLGKYEDNEYVDPQYLELRDNNEENSAIWEEIKSQFIQESGLPASSSITGLFLNFYGASVFSYTMYTTHQSSTGKLNNIYIHDIYHDMVESLRIGKYGESGQVYPTPWNSDIPAEYAFGSKAQAQAFYNLLHSNDNDTSISDSLNNDFKYYGSVMTDAYFAMDYFSDSWDYLGFLQTDIRSENDTSLLEWINGDTYDSTADASEHPMANWRLGCNQDIMGHSGKGLLGLRVDGVNDLTLSNIKIENLHEHGALGSNACGKYWGFDVAENGGHFKQTEPMQHGFSGNNLQAMSITASTDVYIQDSVIINNINNDYALAFGLSLWTADDIYIDTDALIVVNNVNAGLLLESNTLGYGSLPNQAPEACATRLQTSDSSVNYASNVDVEDNGANNVIACNVNGHVTCLDDGNSTMYGNYFQDSVVCDHIKSVDDLRSFIGTDAAMHKDENEDSLFVKSNQIHSEIKTGSDSDGIVSNSNNEGKAIIDSNSINIAIILAVAICVFSILLLVLYCNGKMDKYAKSWNIMGNSDTTYMYCKVEDNGADHNLSLGYGSV